jgi:hypothetical protein
MNKLFLLIFCGFSLPAFAQFDSLGIKVKWCTGKIMFEDNSRMTGYIKYNDKLGLIAFKENINDEDLPLSENRIQAMEFFDEELSKNKKFMSFYMRDDESGWSGKMLFEVILEVKEFAVLSKLGRVNHAIRDKNYNVARTPPRYVKVGYEQFESIYLVDRNGKLEKLLVTSVFEKDKFRSGSALKPQLNKEVLKKYLGLGWEQVNEFAKKNGLNLKERTELIKALEYFRDLENER